MSTAPLDYTNLPASRPRFRFWRWVFVAIATLILIGWSLLSSFKEVDSRMDAVTGTFVTRTTYPFGISPRVQVNLSAVEVRMKRDGIKWTPNMQFVGSHESNVYGMVISRSCGHAPPIMSFHSLPQPAIDSLTVNEFADLMKIMQQGTEQQQRDELWRICDKYYSSPQQ